MAILGARSISNIPSSARPGDWDSVVPFISFQNFPLTAIYSLAPSKPVSDFTFNWFDKICPIITIKILNDVPAGSNSFVVDDTFTDETGTIMDYTFLTKGTVLKHAKTGEEAIVTATPTSNTVSIQKGVGSVPDSTWTAGDILQFQGVTATHRKLALTKVNIDPTRRENAVQKFTEIATDQSLEHDLIEKRIEGFSLADQRIEGLCRLAQGIEETLLSGTPKLSGGSPTSISFDGDILYKMGGIKYLLDTYAPNRIFVNSDVNGVVTESYLNSILRQVFNYDSGNRSRMAICGNGFIQTINEIAGMTVTRYSDPVTERFGLRVFEWISPFGTLYLMQHPLFSASNLYWTHSNNAYERTYSALLLDPDTIVKRVLLPIIEKDNIQSNDDLGKKSAFVTILGLELNPVVYNALLINFKTGA